MHSGDDTGSSGHGDLGSGLVVLPLTLLAFLHRTDKQQAEVESHFVRDKLRCRLPDVGVDHHNRILKDDKTE